MQEEDLLKYIAQLEQKIAELEEANRKLIVSHNKTVEEATKIALNIVQRERKRMQGVKAWNDEQWANKYIQKYITRTKRVH